MRFWKTQTALCALLAAGSLQAFAQTPSLPGLGDAASSDAATQNNIEQAPESTNLAPASSGNVTTSLDSLLSPPSQTPVLNEQESPQNSNVETTQENASIPPVNSEAPVAQSATSIEDILGTQTGTEALSNQNIDINQRLTTALITGTRAGPIMRVSPERVFITMDEGTTGSAQVRVINTGDTPGPIRGINAIGAIDGLLVTHTCEETLNPGDACDIAISYTSDEARQIVSAILMTIQERDRTEIQIPLQIDVVAVEPEPVLQEPVVQAPPALDPNDPRVQAALRPVRPSSEDIARQYYRSIGGMSQQGRGNMSHISLPESMRRQPEPVVMELGSALNVETLRRDPRYPDSIASTDASLPVDRDNILTSDRVIKAVLDTPFSNVMCGKVVAIVESDVYSATSQKPLIQAGSRVIGKCGELVQERAGIVWERILTADGRSISLAGDGMMTRDANGLGGALGRVYKTPFDRYVLPIFATSVEIVSGVVQATFGEDEEQSVTESGTVVQSNSAKNEGIRVATEAARERATATIEELQDVRDVLVVPAGTRIDIEISQDVYFKDERQVLRLADAVYDVTTPPVSSVAPGSPDPLSLIPFRPGLEGPVVTIDGKRYVVQEGGAQQTSQDTPTLTPSGSAQPNQTGAASSRPTASSPVASNQATQSVLSDLGSGQ